MSIENAPPKDSATSPNLLAMSEVDKYGVPLRAFGDGMPPEFFEIVGRILAVNGKIEYLMERLDHLPSSETDGVRKVEQFRRRFDSGRMDRNAIVHSFWAVGTHDDPEVIVGFRYKKRETASGDTATVSIADIPDSERKQDIVQFRLHQLRKLLKRDINTMLIGMQAHTEVSLNSSALHLHQTGKDSLFS